MSEVATNVDTAAVTNGQEPAATPKRRRRGPNKPKTKVADIQLETKAVITQTEILKLLSNYVVSQLGAGTAENMELQYEEDGVWKRATDSLRFATKGSE